MLYFMVYLLVVKNFSIITAQNSAQYLQDAIKDLRYLSNRQIIGNKEIFKTLSPAPAPAPPPPPPPLPPHQLDDTSLERRVQFPSNLPPSLSLTKGELATIYETALLKGDTIKLPNGNDGFIHAAVHEIDQHSESTSIHDDNSAGYYYYYYPIKTFTDGNHKKAPTVSKTITTTTLPPFQVHSHTHEHNIKITKMDENKGKKSLEPLFMAISGFIGMAVMFILSILVFPRFGIKTTKYTTKKNDKINEVARIALEAIEGKGCAERFACELGKTARAFHLGENRFVKLFRRLAPSSFSKHFDRIGKYTNNKLKCTAIPCKKKNVPKKKPNHQKNNNNNKKS